jgi:hypothetical protein
MNERCFALTTQRAIRRGSFDSTADLVKKIERLIGIHNANSRLLVWTATADSILQKLARLCQRISRDRTLVSRFLNPFHSTRCREGAEAEAFGCWRGVSFAC